MSSAPGRTLVALAAAVFVTAAQAAPPAPTKDQVARWVRMLGDQDFDRRQEASKKLWDAGRAAEGALEEAAKSSDPEVARRARDILGRFRWGIYPDTPKEVVELIGRYRSGNNNDRIEVVRKLLERGAGGCRALAKVAGAEENVEQRRAVLAQVSGEVTRTVPRLLADNDLDALVPLLELALAHDARLGVSNYVAFWLLRGKLDERIAHFKALADKKPADKQNFLILAHLYRAAGDRPAARKAAEKAGSRELVDALLYESADWKGLAHRPNLALGDSRLETLGYRAAFRRLAGEMKEFEETLTEIRNALKEPANDRTGALFSGAKALFLNDRPDEAVDLLVRAGRTGMAFEILCARMKYREAFDLVAAARKGKGGKDPLPHLEVLEARMLFALGKKDEAAKTFARLAGEIKAGADKTFQEQSWYEELIDTEYRLGRTEDAYEHCARVLALSKDPGAPGRLLAKVFPDKGEVAAVWWDLVRKRWPKREPLAAMKAVRGILGGKPEVENFTGWVEELARTAKDRKPEEADHLLRALAEAALAARQEALARSCLEKATTPGALTRLGDLLAAKKEWKEAAARYYRAWEKERQEPLPLYQSGWALVRAGREKEGRARMEQAHWLPLGDESARAAFATALAKHGYGDASRREYGLLLRVSQPGSFYAGEALRRDRPGPGEPRDFLREARANEQGMLRCLLAYINFLDATAYARVPSLVHTQRARGYLAAGKLSAARQEAVLAQSDLPGNIELPILLVPELERRGRRKEADALFEQGVSVYEQLCKDYPGCAWAHNSVAWVSACCRRNLDQALVHARRAVELAPDAAGHHDTLAEVYFQRGDKEKAVASQKRAIELNPKKKYFRRQLKRIEAGDPKAERPPEREE